MIVIVFLGPPGVGKGTQSSILSKMLGVPKLATGDILREEIQKASEIGLLAKQIVDRGDLVPDNLMIDIIKNKVTQPECFKGFILDGFPRTIPQANSLQVLFDQLSIVEAKIIFLNTDLHNLVKRISGRFTCKNCGAGYNKWFMKTKKEGICDHCGSTEFIFRNDDNEESVKTRLENYYTLTWPVVEFYRQRSQLIDIDASNSVDEITNSILSKISLDKKLRVVQ